MPCIRVVTDGLEQVQSRQLQYADFFEDDFDTNALTQAEGHWQKASV